MSAHAELVAASVTERVSLVVNGERHEIEVDTRPSLVDLLREQLGLTRFEEGLRPRPVRGVHGAPGRPAAW